VNTQTSASCVAPYHPMLRNGKMVMWSDRWVSSRYSSFLPHENIRAKEQD